MKSFTGLQKCSTVTTIKRNLHNEIYAQIGAMWRIAIKRANSIYKIFFQEKEQETGTFSFLFQTKHSSKKVSTMDLFS